MESVPRAANPGLLMRTPTMQLSKRFIVALLIPGFLLGGIVGHAAVAGSLTNNAVLMSSVPCTVTLNGQAYNGSCTGGFVEATPSPSPTPTPTPAPTPTPTPTPTPAPTPTPTPTPTPAPTPSPTPTPTPTPPPSGSFPIVQSNKESLTMPAV